MTDFIRGIIFGILLGAAINFFLGFVGAWIKKRGGLVLFLQ